MSFLTDIGGLIPLGYQGYKQGYDDESRRIRRDDEDAYAAEQRRAERELMPQKTDLAKKKLAGETADVDFTESQRGIRQSTEAIINQGKADMAPGTVELARTEQGNAIARAKQAGVLDAITNAASAEDARTGIAARAGEYLTQGNFGALTRVFQFATQDKNLFPDWAEFGTPQKVELGGTKERPVLVATMGDGTQKQLNPAFILDAYKKRQATADVAAAKVLKPGEIWQTPSGLKLGEGNDRAYGGGLVQDEDGNWVRVPGVGGLGGAGGAGAGRGSKAPSTPAAQAREALLTIAKDSEVKMQPDQLARAQDYVVRIASQASSPEEAARIAYDASVNPQKIRPDLDSKSGTWSGVYSDPQLAEGRKFELAPNAFKTEDVAKLENGKALVADAVERMLLDQGAAIGRPEAGPQLRTLFLEAAHDPARRKALEGVTSPENLPALQRKLDLIKAHTAKPKPTTARQDQPAAKPPAPAAPPPGSPAARHQARQQEARAAEQQKQAAKQAETDKLSAEFRRDAKALKPLELAQKYEQLRWKLPTEDAAELQRIERNIR
jgi:hypothetical protein